MIVIAYSVIGILFIVIICLQLWYIKRTYQKTIISRFSSTAQPIISVLLLIATITLAIYTCGLFIETQKYAGSTIENYRIRNRPFVKIGLSDIKKVKNVINIEDQQNATLIILLLRIKNYGNFPAFVINMEAYIKKTDSSGEYLKISRGKAEKRKWDNLALFQGDEANITRQSLLSDPHVEFIKGVDEPVYIVMKIEYYTLGGDDTSQKDPPFCYWSKFKYVGFNEEDVIGRKIETYKGLTQQQKDKILQQKRFSIIECGVDDKKFVSIND
jgi:hypothetical protein